MAEQNAKDMISAYLAIILPFGRKSAQLFSRDPTASKLTIEFECLV